MTLKPEKQKEAPGLSVPVKHTIICTQGYLTWLPREPPHHNSIRKAKVPSSLEAEAFIWTTGIF